MSNITLCLKQRQGKRPGGKRVQKSQNERDRKKNKRGEVGRNTENDRKWQEKRERKRDLFDS